MKVLIIIGLITVLVETSLSRNILDDGNEIDQINTEWTLYKKMHGKMYKGEEEKKRLNIYLDNKQKISEHNNKFLDGLVSFSVKINQFTDMDESEINILMKGNKQSTQKTGKPFVDDGNKCGAKVDWRPKGVVTPIKDQKKCGSCWAFSSTGSLEGQHALKTGKLVSLSEQNLMDCSSAYGNKGCIEGSPDWSFNYIRANGGIDTEASYPYTAQNGTCYYNKANIGATVRGHVDIPHGNEIALMNAVCQIGPISVQIDATNWSFHHYSGGLYNAEKCSTTNLDHAVIVVGYGTENGKDYWLVKNSWGITWGEEGYIKMSRNANNQCGIASSASYPLV